MNLKIDKSWSLFLDRDGVINERLPGDYVKKLDQFILIENSLNAISVLSSLFGRIFVVSNQQGIGKELMTVNDLSIIHNELLTKVQASGGRIDKIYFSPYLKSDNHITRKPSVGMGLLAKKEFRDVSFRKSVMVGDSVSDMKFGKRLGMKTVMVGSDLKTIPDHRLVDFHFNNLYSFAEFIKIGS